MALQKRKATKRSPKKRTPTARPTHEKIRPIEGGPDVQAIEWIPCDKPYSQAIDGYITMGKQKAKMRICFYQAALVPGKGEDEGKNYMAMMLLPGPIPDTIPKDTKRFFTAEEAADWCQLAFEWWVKNACGVEH